MRSIKWLFVLSVLGTFSACAATPDLSGFGKQTAGLTSSIVAENQEVRNRYARIEKMASEVKYEQDIVAIKRKEFEQRAKSIDAVMETLVIYSQTLVDLAAAGETGGGAWDSIVASMKEAAAILNIAMPGGGTAVQVGGKLASVFAAEYTKAQAQESLAKSMSVADKWLPSIETELKNLYKVQDRMNVVEIITDGDIGTATYKVSTDGGETFDDNNGTGYVTSASGFVLSSGDTITFGDGSTLVAGTRFYEKAGPYMKLITGIGTQEEVLCGKVTGIESVKLYRGLAVDRDHTGVTRLDRFIGNVGDRISKIDASKGVCQGQDDSDCLVGENAENTLAVIELLTRLEPSYRTYTNDIAAILAWESDRRACAKTIYKAVQEWKKEHDRIADYLEECGGFQFTIFNSKCEGLDFSKFMSTVQALKNIRDDTQ